MAMDLTRNSFVALAAVTWADGRMSRSEAEGLLRAAKACGLDEDDLAAVKGATESEVRLDAFDAAGMSPWQRGLTFAIASWLARIDGVTHQEEHQSLVDLGDRLDLAEPKQKAAISAAFDVSCAPGGHRPEKYDFEKLVQNLRTRLPSLVE